MNPPRIGREGPQGRPKKSRAARFPRQRHPDAFGMAFVGARWESEMRPRSPDNLGAGHPRARRSL